MNSACSYAFLLAHYDQLLQHSSPYTKVYASRTTKDLETQKNTYGPEVPYYGIVGSTVLRYCRPNRTHVHANQLYDFCGGRGALQRRNSVLLAELIVLELKVTVHAVIAEHTDIAGVYSLKTLQGLHAHKTSSTTSDVLVEVVTFYFTWGLPTGLASLQGTQDWT